MNGRGSPWMLAVGFPLIMAACSGRTRANAEGGGSDGIGPPGGAAGATSADLTGGVSGAAPATAGAAAAGTTAGGGGVASGDSAGARGAAVCRSVQHRAAPLEHVHGAALSGSQRQHGGEHRFGRANTRHRANARRVRRRGHGGFSLCGHVLHGVAALRPVRKGQPSIRREGGYSDRRTEGAMVAGFPADDTELAVLRNIQAARYGALSP